MEKEKQIPKNLYDIVSELVNFIDEADLQRKEKQSKDIKDYIGNTSKNNNVKKLF